MAVGTKLGEIATQRFALIPDGRAADPHRHLPRRHRSVDTRSRSGSSATPSWRSQDLHAQLAPQRAEIRDQLADYGAEVRDGAARWLGDVTPRLTSDDRPTSVARLVHELNRVMPPGSVLVTDGGFASHWTGCCTTQRSRAEGSSPTAASHRSATDCPAASAPGWRTADDTPVVALTGDGGLNMTLGELETAVRVGRPLTLIVVNNAASGYVKALQHDMLDGRYQSSDLTLLDYAAIAREVGWDGIRVDDPECAPGRARARGAGAIQTHAARCSRDPRSQ